MNDIVGKAAMAGKLLAGITETITESEKLAADALTKITTGLDELRRAHEKTQLAARHLTTLSNL